jgi:hypothetical protein
MNILDAIDSHHIPIIIDDGITAIHSIIGNPSHPMYYLFPAKNNEAYEIEGYINRCIFKTSFCCRHLSPNLNVLSQEIILELYLNVICNLKMNVTRRLKNNTLENLDDTNRSFILFNSMDYNHYRLSVTITIQLE